jgi:myo-inositol-1(or 4)-monophosphatase
MNMHGISQNKSTNDDQCRAMLNVAKDAARAAGLLALQKMNEADGRIKAGTELVTQVDSLCQSQIIEHIRKHYPDHGFLGEESNDGGCLKIPPSGTDRFWWIIDPIDGTNNYAHKLPVFGVSIGVMHSGYPVAGVIYEPVSDSMFTAYRGASAMLNDQCITVSDEQVSRFASIVVDTNFEVNLKPSLVDLMLKTRFRNLGAATLHMAYVANGSFIGCILTGPKLWDIAAGAIILECAGGILTDWQFKDVFPIEVETYEPQKMKILCSNKVAFNEIRQQM